MSTTIRTHCHDCAQLVEVTFGQITVAKDSVVADVHLDVCACGPRDLMVKSPAKRKNASAKPAAKKKASKK